uniref:Ig-like domain-containing protein n=1 Tax=Leptobrachium leishanense TaxID=445787 RepID=A0A8C5Q944_9ANUR
MGTAGITGVLLLTAFFLGAADQPDPDYMTEVKTECHFTNGTERVRFLYRDFYNKEEFVYFDSDIGKFIAKTELGKLDADTLNQQEDTLNYYKSQVPTVCVPNYDIWHSVTADRRVVPSGKISVMASVDDLYQYKHTIICNVFGFYPSGIEVKWFRNEQEQTTQVGYSGPHSDGDWTFQFWVSLETDIERGDVFTCEVHHASLKDPLQVRWKPDASDSAKSKMVTGIVGFVLGGIFIAVGLVLYLKSRKAALRVPTNEQTARNLSGRPITRNNPNITQLNKCVI